MSDRAFEGERRVTPLELFFDLVFVFGFTEVTTLVYANPTWGGLARGLLALGVIWWAWAAYAWLTNTVDADAGPVVATLLIATGAMFVAALAVPEAFAAHRYVFAVAFAVVLTMFVVLFALSAKGEPDLLGAVLRATPWTMFGAALIIVAAFAPSDARPVLWLAALGVGILGPALTNMEGWRVRPAHFAERHNLIVIIALGESLVAIGIGARNTALGLDVIAAVVLGLAIAASFWLAYFDFFSATLQQLIATRRGRERITLARDAYTYLHLPMIAGIVLFAYAMRTAVAHVHSRLHLIPAIALCFGPALFLLAHVALRWRVSRTVGRGRPAAAVAFVLILPATLFVPALAALGLVTAIWLALHAYELVRWREQRAVRRGTRAGKVLEDSGIVVR